MTAPLAQLLGLIVCFLKPVFPLGLCSLPCSLLILHDLTERFHSSHGFNDPTYADDSQIHVSSSEFSLELQFHSSESSV